MFRSMALASGVVAIAFAAPLAQTTYETESTAMPPPDEQLITEQKEQQILSTELIGMDVLQPEGEKVGTLASLLFDEDEKIVGGVVSVGGFLGIGAKSVALSWDAFTVRKDERVVLVDLTREQLDAAPAFKDLAQIEAEAEAERARMQMQEDTQQPMQPAQPPPE
ncbi:MAG: PRC-barrel domain-containing protein [Kiloniellales bacterium]